MLNSYFYDLKNILVNWASKKRNEIFVIDGPSQIGKTQFIHEYFMRVGYDNIYVDVKQNKNMLDKLIDDVYNSPENFYSAICFHFQRQVSQNLITLIFDHIEFCPRLRQYFKTLVNYEKINIVAITCGGLSATHYKNLLTPSEEKIHRLFPLSFKEFMVQIRQSSMENHLATTISNKQSLGEYLSSEVYKLFKLYNLIGGYPSVVENYINNKDIVSCINMNKRIIKRQFDHAKELLPDEDQKMLDTLFANIYEVVHNGKYNLLENITPYKMKQLLSFLSDEYILNIPTALDLNEPTKSSSGKKIYFFQQCFYYATNQNFVHNDYFNDLYPSEDDVLADYFFNQRIQLKPTQYGICRNETYFETDALLVNNMDINVVEFKGKRLTTKYNIKISERSNNRIKPGILLFNGNIFDYDEVTVLPSYSSSFIDYLFNPLIDLPF